MRGVLQLAAWRRRPGPAWASSLHRRAIASSSSSSTAPTAQQRQRWVRAFMDEKRRLSWLLGGSFDDDPSQATPRLLGGRRGLASGASSGAEGGAAAAAEGGGGDGDGPSTPARVFTWGQGTEGQLGHWPFEKSGLTSSYAELSPRELRVGKDGGHNSLGFVELAAGLNHSAGVTADGKVRNGLVKYERNGIDGRMDGWTLCLTDPYAPTPLFHPPRSCTRGATGRTTSWATGARPSRR